jgi:hypothetical protein
MIWGDGPTIARAFKESLNSGFGLSEAVASFWENLGVIISHLAYSRDAISLLSSTMDAAAAT